MTPIATKYVIYAKRRREAPWIKIDSHRDYDTAIRIAERYKRDYPHSQVKVES